VEYETQAIFAGLEAGLDDPDEEVRRTCAWGLCHWDSMTAERICVVLRRLGRVDRGLRDFLAFAVCRSQAALPEVVAFLHAARCVVLRRLGRVDRGLRDFLAFAVCRSQAALPEVVAFLHDSPSSTRVVNRAPRPSAWWGRPRCPG
jgi:hypothetical protein